MVGGGVMIFTIFCLFKYRSYIPNLFKIGPVVLEKKRLTHDARRTTNDDGRQPIAVGHLSDSGDLIKDRNFEAFQYLSMIICKESGNV